jgi:diguanylate cyclase (GGDEF)-like protein
MYLILILSFNQHFSKLPRVTRTSILGLLSGFVALTTTLITVKYYNNIYLDGKFVVIFIVGVLFGGQASIISGIIIGIGAIYSGAYSDTMIILQLVSITIIANIVYRVKMKNGMPFVQKYVSLFYIVSIIIASIWVVLLAGINTVVNFFNTPHVIISFLILPILSYGLIKLFIYEQIRRDNEEELIRTKEALMEKNEALTQLYEELSTTEEELRQQFDLLKENKILIEKREERNKLIIKAGSEALWGYDLATKEFDHAEGLDEIFEEKIDSDESFFKLARVTIHLDDFKKVNNLIDKINTGEIDHYCVDYRRVLRDSSVKWVRSKVVVLRDSKGEITQIAGSFSDITKIKEHEEELHRLVYYDWLTGLPNRRYLYEKLTKDLSENKKVNLLYMDLDNFKNINDTKGHTIGDRLLEELGRRLDRINNNNNNMFFARIGGDEFAVVVESSEMDADQYLMKFVDRLMNEVKKKYIIDDVEFLVTSSIGISSYPKDGQTLEDIIKSADTALHYAKSLGKNKCAVFSKMIYERYLEKLNLESLLREAIDNHDIEVFYQPQFNFQKEVVGFEALARWTSKVVGVISPAKFIPIAEQTGLIAEIRQQVFEKVCRFIKKLTIENEKVFIISVNISPLEINRDDFLESIMAEITGHDINSKNIGIEITESALMESYEVTREKLEFLKRAGFELSLDDFGTGYSSLNYLSKIPVSIVKIDKSFVDRILDDEKHMILTRTIIKLSHELNMHTIAEGVETEEQFKVLMGMECDYIQGYYLGKPMPEEKALELISTSGENGIKFMA